MDSQITAAARALAAGDPIGALKRVALRDDPPALALRGIAMAQLGELGSAKALLRRASRAFGHREPLARARCIVAEAEIALASRELGDSDRPLAAAIETLDAHGDVRNALHARGVAIRRLLLLGRVAEAEHALARVELAAAPPMLLCAFELMSAGVAVRCLRTRDARAAIERAAQAAQRSGIASLLAEVDTARRALEIPAARHIADGTVRPLVLEEVEALLASDAFVVDECRHVVRDPRAVVPLARRPVLFALARALAEAWPNDAPRDTLIAHAFEVSRPNESHRARLRVEVGRLRRALRAIASLEATPRGFIMKPRRAREVVVLARPLDDAHGRVLALLSDGEAWSSSSLAMALGVSQRTLQRELMALEQDGKIVSFGRARAQRWHAPPIGGFTPVLLLPPPLPID
jgi:hypothetical protein